MSLFTREFGGWRYRISRWVIRSIAQPRLAGLPIDQVPTSPVYVLENRAISDVVVLDLVCQQQQLPNPLQPLELEPQGEFNEQRRFFALFRRGKGVWRRRDLSTHSSRMVRLLTKTPAPLVNHVSLQPVAVYWGRAPHREGSIWRQLVSENWAMTSRLRRFVNLAVNRRDIVVHFGQPLALTELRQPSSPPMADNRVVRRAARLLRVGLRNQRVASMGPDFSHRRTLMRQLLNSTAVASAIAADPSNKSVRVLKRRANRYALQIISNFSYPTIRILERLLRWFWNQIYAGIELNGLERMNERTAGHTVVYVPSHRSHVDYLLMSYLLFQHGMMIPHIAAGDNLNLPILGSVLRRGGAFFMRRSFRDDALYGAVFNEYLYQVYRRGHCVEFFPEGGRTRTGRLLPAKLGLLKMTLAHQQRGIPRPIALVPVFFGYEKLIEANSYLTELQGSKKRKESFTGLLRSLRLIKQNFGKVTVNIGEPIILDTWLAKQPEQPLPQQPHSDATVNALAQHIMQGINASAALNPVSLVALVTLAMPRAAISKLELADQIDCYLALLRADQAHHDFSLPKLTGEQCVDYVAQLQLLRIEDEDFGTLVSHEPFNAVLMTWYRNNVAHTLALPALVACLLIRRGEAISQADLVQMLATIYPLLAQELSTTASTDAYQRWLAHLTDAGLIMQVPTGYQAPDVASAEFHQLEMLAQVVMQTLERMFIVTALLGQQDREPWQLDELRSSSRLLAKKLNRLFGINAPEFFDQRLFDGFIHALVERGYVSQNEAQQLTPTPIIAAMLGASDLVINPTFRHAVLRAN